MVAPASPPHAARVFALLGDLNRLNLCLALAARGELHVAALCGAIGMSPTAVSHHLMLLRAGRVVVCRREGRFRYYSLTPGGVVPELLRLVTHPVEPRVMSAGPGLSTLEAVPPGAPREGSQEQSRGEPESGPGAGHDILPLRA